MQISQKQQTYILRSLKAAMKNSKLYHNKQVGKITTIKKSKFHKNNRYISFRATRIQFKNI